MTGTLRPQTITSVRTGLSFISPAAVKVAAMIAPAQWGEIGKVETLVGLGDFIAKFAGDTSDGINGFRGADLFFRNGGILKFVRIASDAASKADIQLMETATPEIDVEAKFEGTYGNNIKIEVTENASEAGNRDLRITDGRSVEIYNNVGLGFDNNNDIIAAVNARSNLVTMSLTGETGTSKISIQSVDLTGGDNGEAVAIADYTEALNEELYSENFQYLIVPGLVDEGDLLSLSSALSLRETNERRFASLISGVEFDNNDIEGLAVAKSRLTSLTGKNVRIVAPGISYLSSITRETVNLNGSYLACAFAGLLCSLNYSESATHKTLRVRDLFINEDGKKYYNKIEQEQSLESGIIPITLIGNNIQVVRDITREDSTTSIFFSGTIVDIINYVTLTLENYLNTIIGLPNTTVNRSSWASTCDTILKQMIRDNILEDANPVIVNEGESPNFINVEVGVFPAFSVDFINLTITI